MRCNTCNQEFDPGNLSSVIIHEHGENTNPAFAIGIKGKQLMGNDLYPNEGPQFWAGANNFILGGYKLDSIESDDFKRGYFQAQKDFNPSTNGKQD